MAKLFFTQPSKPTSTMPVNFLPLHGGGFRAVAVGLMDQSMRAGSPGPAWISSILARYAEFFPNRMPVWSINQSRDLELQQLTYTLARIALDELCTNPIKYPAAFAHRAHEDILDWAARMILSPHKHAVVALAHAVNLPLEIHVIDPMREIYLRECYMVNTAGSALALRLQAGRFSPQVDQSGVWRDIDKLDYLPLETCSFNPGVTLQTIDTMLEQSDLAVWNLYQKNLGEMQSHASDWRAIYQKNWLEISQINILGCEHGLQAYFDKLAEKYGNLSSYGSPWLVGVARAITLDAFTYQVNQTTVGYKEN